MQAIYVEECVDVSIVGHWVRWGKQSITTSDQFNVDCIEEMISGNNKINYKINSHKPCHIYHVALTWLLVISI